MELDSEEAAHLPDLGLGIRGEVLVAELDVTLWIKSVRRRARA